jgi:penicillin-binding protein 2
MKTGPAFGESIKFEKTHKHANFGKTYKAREVLLVLVLLLGSGIIFARLFFLQIVEGSYYRNLSDNNRTRTVSIHAPRGIIFDRDGIPLVFNLPGFRQIQKSSEGEDTLKLLERDKALRLISEGEKNLEIDSLRNYPYKEIASHVLGYTGQISEEELKEKAGDYTANDLTGKTGIEKQYESFLRGIPGKELVEVDSLGNTIRNLGQTDPIPGKDITLTLDLSLQKVSYEALSEIEKGAIIVSTPKGEVLSLVSKPSFDPNLFTMGESYSVSDSQYDNLSDVLLDQENQPLLNRTIAGAYPPGSTFKLVTAAAGLESGLIDKDYAVEDTGILQIGEFSFGNWYFLQHGKKDGEVDVIKGIARSNDIFFYKLGELVGVDRLSQFAEKFGLGDKTGIDLPGEEKGLVPSPKWKEKALGEKWYLGDTYHYGIGQGFLLTTPMQVNYWTQIIANEGTGYVPHLLRASSFELRASKFLSENTIAFIKQGMVESCSEGGVAWPFFEFKVEVACKTGTAQHGGEKTLPHSWITLFAPAEDPEVVVTVLAESSGEGSNIAAPIAKKILEEWFER